MRKKDLFALAAALLGCCIGLFSQPINRPMESYTSGGVNRRSVLRIPVEIKVSRLEGTLNQQLDGLLYEDKDLNDGDRMMVRVHKVDRIQLRMQGQQVFVSAPMSIWVKYNAGISFVEARGKIVADLRTTYSFKPDWSLATQTELTQYRWIEKPVVQVAGLSLPVGALADLVIQNTKKRISREIDAAVAEYFSIGKIAAETWQSLFEPSLASPEYGAWMAVNPLSIGMTAIQTKADTCSATLVIEAKPKVAIGDKPVSLKQVPLPPYSQYSKQEPGFEIHLGAEVPFVRAQELARKAVEGETFSSGKRSVTVQDIELYGQDSLLIVNIRTTGSYNGSVYLKGKPMFNPERNAVEIQDLDFTLETRNFLLKGGAWLLKSTLRKRLQETMDFYLQYNLDTAKQTLEEQLNAFQLDQGFHIRSKVERLEIGGVELTQTGFLVDIKLSGKAAIRNF